jgi:hypothetical protein
MSATDTAQATLVAVQVPTPVRRKRKTAQAVAKWRNRPPEDEGRRDKFVRLGTRRVNRALTSIRLLGNLASSNYEWNEQDIAAMRLSIVSALDQSLSRFDRRKPAIPAFSGFAPPEPQPPNPDPRLNGHRAGIPTGQ